MSAGVAQRALGIDFGGTSVKVALVTGDGVVQGSRSFGTDRVQGVDGWLDLVAEAAKGLGLPSDTLAGEVVGMGVGVPGFVDFEAGRIHELTNVRGWAGVPLADILERRFGVPARVDNDANAMALGECTFGAGRGFRHVVFVTLGTGVGGALLLDGRLYRGAHAMAGEIGHVSVDMNGIASPQGRGGLEQYIGNRSLVARARAALEAGRESSLRKRAGGDLSALSVKMLAEAAAGGDGLSREIFDFLGDTLAAALASITYVLQPERFIVGGGVSQAGELVFGPLRRHLRERLSPFFADRVAVLPAALGPGAGMIGAATLVLRP